MRDLKDDLGLEENHKNFNFNQFFNLDDVTERNKKSLFKGFFDRTYSEKYQLSNGQYIDLNAILDPGESGENKSLPEFTDEQYIKATKSIRKRRKIRGAAGSGKTTVLAKRVANSSKELGRGEKILVVTYNMTMCNYLQDKIVAEGGMNLNKLGVDITHYHSLYNWKKVGETYYRDGKSRNEIYDAVFIDEGQDFESEWFKTLIKDYLKNPDETKNEYVIFADEAQNVYRRKQNDTFIDGRKTLLPVTPVSGNWATLTKNFRMDNNHIHQVANNFLREFLNREIDINKELFSHQQLNLEQNISESPVLYKKIGSLELIEKNIRAYVDHLIKVKHAKINDIVILSGSTELLRQVENKLSNSKLENNIFVQTATTFVPKKEIDIGIDSDNDKSYKRRFFRNLGPIKFSTIQSFKGWEGTHVILLAHKENREKDRNESFDDITYVGVTRAKDDLFVIDHSGRYEDFFKSQTADVRVLK